MIKKVRLFMSISLLFIGLFLVLQACDTKQDTKVKIGILHSMTGTMSFSERDLVDVISLAIKEINLDGGLLGKKLEPVLADGASDWNKFANEAERLITEDKVAVIFGCWTSSCRKSVKPVIERHHHLMFYPLQYEGLEQSPNIIYTGATPNQQIIPSIHWALENIGVRVYLVGSDYIFPRAANMIIKDQLKSRGITPLGETYLPLGSSDLAQTLKEIAALKPDLVVNTINGDSNIAFFKGMNAINKTKVLSYSIGEPEVRAIGIDLLEGHFAAWNYFQSIDSDENRRFIKAFKLEFGAGRVVNDPMEATYVGVRLWAQAVRSAGTFEPLRIRSTLANQSLNAPHGVVSVEAATQHLWKTVRIGQVRDDGQFDIVWSSESPIRPSPFPTYHNKQEWLKRVRELKLK
ncbi:urea ABC transporter substrate-binding protein [Shewanella sp. D64]|uniref:urea ABC transporter substrate-binding protein n=1 Tax=unclassified Shewanella TaxID=196818 RepID=UPI0022BA5345|nr:MULTISPECIES: urea ABC transporter substrate-binding protein [unclassified Shewanella]MEC4724393.1 urea ABC transporter substrate-binding protein [Shewanella sp. D64]MEC4736830.1 urea ABC transporter substrate-binding protein [Shewanella sp. E94]WBJ94511.1 urea ABC transporter substrate-binding protein [Shewanella sp. MTB7]